LTVKNLNESDFSVTVVCMAHNVGCNVLGVACFNFCKQFQSADSPCSTLTAARPGHLENCL